MSDDQNPKLTSGGFGPAKEPKGPPDTQGGGGFFDLEGNGKATNVGLGSDGTAPGTTGQATGVENPKATTAGLGGPFTPPEGTAPAAPKDFLLDKGPTQADPIPTVPDNDVADLAPVAAPPPIPGGGHADLPAPKIEASPVAADPYADLPAPLPSHPRATDLLAPAGGADLPSPRGFFDDAVAPVGAAPLPSPGGDLPAPKGFFDDAVAPAGAAPPAPGGDLPAPKGFFDDAVAPAGAAPPPTPGGALPAPKGFFDDAVAPAGATPPPTPGGALPAPKGFFDDAVAPASGNSPLDLDGLDLSAPGGPAPAAGAGAQPFGLDSLDSLDLQAPAQPQPGAPPDVPLDIPTQQNTGLNLPETPAAPAQPSMDSVLSFNSPDAGADDDLSSDIPDAADLDAPPAQAKETEGRKSRRKSRRKKKEKKKLLTKTNIIIGAAATGVVALGVIGFLVYSSISAKDEAEAKFQDTLQKAEAELRSAAKGHWERAATIAQGALKERPNEGIALGIVAESHYAAVLDEGTNVKKRRAAGAEAIGRARSAALKGLHLEKANALASIIERRTQDAITRLRKVAQEAPDDGDTQLYLGWAHAAIHQHPKAIAAFKKALSQNPQRTPALYGLARSMLATGDFQGARENFLKISQNKTSKSHIGAQVGLAQIADIDRFGDRENRYLEILQRDNLENADPRSVSLAWALAGDEALKAGRVEESERRYAKALELDPENLSAFTGQGKVAHRKKNLELAQERLGRVLALDPTNIDALLTRAEVLLAAEELAEAQESVDALLERGLKDAESLVRAHMVRAQVFEADSEQTMAAEAAYKDAVAAAPEGQIVPLIALSRLYVKLGRGQDAVAVLKPLRARAATDAAAAVALGVALLDSGDSKGAEETLRQALTQRPGDVEATFQLGRSLHAQGRNEEAIERLSSAYQSNESREDIGLQLAALYEQLRRTDDAAAMYERLLSSRSPSINARARAGRFFAMLQQYERAASLGEMILQEQENHPAGLFLSAEAMFAKGLHREARERYQEAVRLDPQPQYLNSLAFASERLRLLEDAVTYYSRAAKDPNYAKPRLGLARVRLARSEYKLAVKPLLEAREIEPNLAEAHYSLGRAYRGLREHEKAIDSFRAASALDPTFADAHFYCGLSLFSTDQASTAVASFEAAVDNAKGNEEWLDEAYYQLGFVANIVKKKDIALKAWDQYLLRTTGDDPRRRSVIRGVLRLKAR